MRKHSVLWLVVLLCMLPAMLASAEGNLLENPGFEALNSKDMPLGWSTGAYLTQDGYTTFSVGEGQDGNGAVIRNFGGNDARFYQTVDVEPNSIYRLSGYVMAEGGGDTGWGANLSIEGIYLDVDSHYDTEGKWCYTELYGRTGPDQRELTVYVRLGGYGGESVGKAYFDNVCLEKLTALPAGVTCENWYSVAYSADDPDEWDDEEESEASPFWPWLLVLSVLWLVLGGAVILLLPRFKGPAVHGAEAKKLPLFALVGLILSFLLRWIIAASVEGYQVDVGCFSAWSSTMANYGPWNFYQNAGFCDYPPGYMLWLGITELVARGLSALFGGTLPGFLSRTVLIKLTPMLCDMGMAVLAYHVAVRRDASRKQAGLLSLLVAWCPALICNSAAWCQVDAVLCLLLALVVWYAMEHRWQIALPVYMLAVLAKPQALMAGPVGLLALGMEFMPGLRTVIAQDEKKPGKKAAGEQAFFGVPDCLRQILIGLGGAAGVALVILLPFMFGQKAGWLINLYGQTLGSYQYATINTTNLYYLFSANWHPLTENAVWGVKLVLALTAVGWGGWHGFRLMKRNAPLWWLDAGLMGCFGLFYLITLGMNVSWGVVGYVAMAMAFAIVIPLMLRSGRLDTLPLMGGLLFLLLYVLGTKMHERYLFPAVILLAMAYIIHRDWRILLTLLISSAVMFINEGIVLDNSIRLGSVMGHLNNDTLSLNMLLSAVNLCLVPLLLWTAGDVVLKGDAVCDTEALAQWVSKRVPDRGSEGRTVKQYASDASLHWKRIDTILVTAVTLIYSVVALWNLGSVKAPQTFWTSTTEDEQVVLDLGDQYDGFRIAYYCAVSYHNFAISVSDDGENWTSYQAEMNEGSCYQWKYLDQNGSYRLQDVPRYSGRYVRVSAKQIGLQLGEIVFLGADGNAIRASLVSRTGEDVESAILSDPAAIVDEPDSLVGEPGWYNSTYFDEIYHARTGKELLDGKSAYEWTHPPLGKVIMSWFIALFGMTPFGWRFGGALMGILMLPFMYLLAKQLTKRTDMAFLAMSLMALDCMHLAQTRIATIDSYPVFFIIAAYFFMVRFMQKDIVGLPMKKLLPSLGLSGLMISLAIASKWIGLYAAAGLAVLYFWTLARHIRMAYQNRGLRKTGGKAGKKKTPQTDPVKQVWQRSLYLCLWCCLFFVALPITVYLLSYIPHFASRNPQSLGEFIRLVIQEQQNMYNYHATPGLGMDHAFYSPWYEWPIIGKPMYYAMGYYQPAGCSMSIFSFGNPMVWWIGIVGIAVTFCVWAGRHLYRLDGQERLLHLDSHSWDITPAFVLIGLMAQLLPWVLVPRGTYIYHYFASVPFLILGITLMFHRFSEKEPRAGRVTMIVYLVLTLISFLVFYPYASGITVPTWWLDLGRRILSLYYA